MTKTKYLFTSTFNIKIKRAISNIGNKFVKILKKLLNTHTVFFLFIYFKNTVESISISYFETKKITKDPFL